MRLVQRERRLKRSLAALLFVAGAFHVDLSDKAACAATIFTSDFTINVGDSYFSVEAHAAAHATVLGGLVGNRLQLYNSATAELHGGSVNAFYAQDATSADIFPGSYIKKLSLSATMSPSVQVSL